jgi:hypothetical protein
MKLPPVKFMTLFKRGYLARRGGERRAPEVRMLQSVMRIDSGLPVKLQ